MAYQKIAQGNLFKNEAGRGPFMSNGKVEVLEDLRKGDIISLSLWKNEGDADRGPSVSLTIQRRTEDAAPQSVPQQAAPVADDDIPF